MKFTDTKFTSHQNYNILRNIQKSYRNDIYVKSRVTTEGKFTMYGNVEVNTCSFILFPVALNK